MAFFFVDRITALAPGHAARGYFRVPFEAPEWPAFLLAEAVGQLAGWAAMAELDFRLRPVAALAGEVAIHAEASPGDEVELSVHLDRFERGTVLYGGTASSSRGELLLEMKRCVGPLLPTEEFEDPALARARLERLHRGDGDTSAFVPIDPLACEMLELEPGIRLRAAMHVPTKAALFADHFPRRPVYPATLLLDRQMRLAHELLADRAWRARRMTHVKMGAFVYPGDRLELEVSLISRENDSINLALVGFRGGARVSRARVEYARDGA